MYIDGVVDNLKDYAYGELRSHTGQDLSIGAMMRNVNEGFYFFPGLIDDVRLYARALTQNEVQLLASGKADMGLQNVYHPVREVTGNNANAYPKIPEPTTYDPANQDIINIYDFAAVALDWLKTP